MATVREIRERLAGLPDDHELCAHLVPDVELLEIQVRVERVERWQAAALAATDQVISELHGAADALLRETTIERSLEALDRYTTAMCRLVGGDRA